MTTVRAAEGAEGEPAGRGAIRAAAVVVPAHNEQELLPSCLRALYRARRAAECRGLTVLTVVVADACTDLTAEIARAAGAVVAESDARNAGAARALGSAVALGRLCAARFTPDEVYLAHTDADSVVRPDWLLRHIARAAAGYDGVVGGIRVADWSLRPPGTSRLFHRAGRAEPDYERIYGANLGVRADVYLRIGGFPPLTVGEDRALVDALAQVGARLAHDGSLTVTTSARVSSRAPGGFSDYLTALVREPTVGLAR